MSHWKSINNIYLYDGTLEGLFTIIFDCYVRKTIPSQIVPQNNYTENLLDTPIFLKTDYEKSERIEKGILKTISYSALYDVHYAFLCEEKNKELNILKFLLHGFTIGPKIDTMLSLEYVFAVKRMQKKAFGECHRLKGLTRFSEVSPHLLYSSIHPTHAIIEPLGHHFIQRLPNENFILHDKHRNEVFVYNTKEYRILPANTIHIPSLTEKEKEFQKLWQIFFQTIAITERKNPKLQMQYMPKKYWQDLVEKPT